MNTKWVEQGLNAIAALWARLSRTQDVGLHYNNSMMDFTQPKRKRFGYNLIIFNK